MTLSELWLDTSVVRPTLPNILPVLANIRPDDLLPKWATLSFACRSLTPGHMLLSTLTGIPDEKPLKSKHPFVPLNRNCSPASTLLLRNARIKCRTQSGEKAAPNSEISDQTSAPNYWHVRPKTSNGPGATAFVLMSENSNSTCTIWIWLQQRPASVVIEEQTTHHTVMECPKHRTNNGACCVMVSNDETKIGCSMYALKPDLPEW